MPQPVRRLSACDTVGLLGLVCLFIGLILGVLASVLDPFGESIGLLAIPIGGFWALVVCGGATVFFSVVALLTDRRARARKLPHHPRASTVLTLVLLSAADAPALLEAGTGCFVIITQLPSGLVASILDALAIAAGAAGLYLIQIWVVMVLAQSMTRKVVPGHCPGCGYDVRGLPIGARCPECGLERVGTAGPA